MNNVFDAMPAGVLLLVAALALLHLGWRSIRGPLRTLARIGFAILGVGCIMVLTLAGHPGAAGEWLLILGFALWLCGPLLGLLARLVSICEPLLTTRTISILLRADLAPDLRVHAASMLESIRDEDARSILLRVASDKNPAVRSAALNALSNLDREDVITVETIIPALSDPDPAVRESAAHALRYSLPLAIPALMQTMQDESDGVRLEAMLALESLRAVEAFEMVARCLQSDPSQEVRYYAADALLEIDRDRAIAPLIAALTDPHDSVRQSAIRALGRSRNPQAIAVLCKILSSWDDESRETAADALDDLLHIDDPSCVSALESLHRALSDAVPRVRAKAAEALCILTHPGSVPFLVASLADHDGEVRAMALRALARIDAAGHVSHLLHALSDDDYEVRKQAAKSMKYAGPGVVSKLLPYLNDPVVEESVKVELVKSLGKIGDITAIPALLQLQDGNEWIRKGVIDALIRMPDPRALPVLLETLTSDDENTLGEAVLALAAIGDDSAVPAIVALVQHEASYVRRRAVWALSFFSPQLVVPTIASALLDEDDHVQSVAFDVLTEITDKTTLQHLASELPPSEREHLEAVFEHLEESGNEQEAPRKARQDRSVRIGTSHYE